jgi:putative hydrolase of the HAD superfamily
MTSKNTLWLFDLDNTLHNASHAIFPAISANMNAYMAQVLAAGGAPSDAVAVDAVRELYWARYGATLLGMVKHHGVRVEDFLHAAHQFDNLTMMIRAERGLARLFRRLPGKKILLTNAPRIYSRHVMRHLGLHKLIADHVSIESMRLHGQLRPKPSSQFLRKFAAQQKVHPRRCVLVEDTIHNLRAAKRIGMRTVWVTRYLDKLAAKKSAQCVDMRVRSVLELARVGGGLGL